MRLDELVPWLLLRAGAAHTSVLRTAGFSVHTMRTAVASGMVERVRRSWLVVPDVDPALRRAVECGGRLTCLSEARRIGLWTPDDTAVHVAVSPNASRLDAAGVRLHWSSGPAPVGDGTAVDPMINVLFHAARCAPMPDAAAVWESAIRKRLVEPAVLERVAWRSEPARALAATASVLSDSGIETRFVHLMRSLGVRVAQQVRLDGHRVDGLIGRRLVVQLDGFAHHRAGDRRRDLRADARLALRGFTVLRFDYAQILFHPDEVQEVIRAAVAQGLHR